MLQLPGLEPAVSVSCGESGNGEEANNLSEAIPDKINEFLIFAMIRFKNH